MWIENFIYRYSDGLLCPFCDYDLRATTSDLRRCPECGILTRVVPIAEVLAGLALTMASIRLEITMGYVLLSAPGALAIIASGTPVHGTALIALLCAILGHVYVTIRNDVIRHNMLVFVIIYVVAGVAIIPEIGAFYFVSHWLSNYQPPQACGYKVANIVGFICCIIAIGGLYRLQQVVINAALYKGIYRRLATHESTM